LVWSSGLERLVSEVNFYVSSGTLNATHWLTHLSSAVGVWSCYVSL